jgi:hypothetical protein
MLHGLVDVVHVQQAAGIGDDGVSAVEDADFHVLEGGHIGDELRADFLPGGAARGEVILHNPLLELLAEHRPVVGDAIGVLHQPAFTVGGRGRDAVHHGVGEGDMGDDPIGEGRVEQAGQTGHGVARDNTIVGDIVTGHDGVGSEAFGLAPREACRMRPKTDVGSCGFAASRAMAGCCGSNFPVAGLIM